MEITLLDEFKRSWLTSIIGIVLFCSGTWLLTWNEGRAVHHAHSLEEAYNNVIALNPYEGIQPEYDGCLVHISGLLLVDEPLTEPDYGISIQAVKLKRRVQMYQWVEKSLEGPIDYFKPRDFSDPTTTHYYYVTEWRDELVNSRRFFWYGHQNPTDIPLKSHIHISPLVRVGQLILGSELKEKYTNYIDVASDERPERKDIKLHRGIYYHCNDVWNPEVGDIRVQFYYAGVSGEPVSIVAMQKDGILLPYTTSKAHEILLLRLGVLTIAQMFSEERSDAYYKTWKLRGAGIFILFGSFLCLARV